MRVRSAAAFPLVLPDLVTGRHPLQPKHVANAEVRDDQKQDLREHFFFFDKNNFFFDFFLKDKVATLELVGSQNQKVAPAGLLDLFYMVDPVRVHVVHMNKNAFRIVLGLSVYPSKVLRLVFDFSPLKKLP